MTFSDALVIGHRGNGKGAGENSLGSIELAAEAGADAVEIDVRTSRDGRVVVMHDPTLERLTGGRDTRAVTALGWSELARVRLEGDASIACLEEVLDLCRRRGLRLNIEIKRDVPDRRGLVSAVARVVAAASDGPSCWLSSFDPLMLAQLGRALPGVERALLVSPDGWRRALSWLGGPLRVSALHPHHSLIDEAALARWHRLGFAVYPWTVNEPDEMARLLEWGVDGLISDRPSALRALTGRTRTGSGRRRVAPG